MMVMGLMWYLCTSLQSLHHYGSTPLMCTDLLRKLLHSPESHVLAGAECHSCALPHAYFTSLFALQENISAFDKELPPECLADIEGVYRKYKDPTMG